MSSKRLTFKEVKILMLIVYFMTLILNMYLEVTKSCVMLIFFDSECTMSLMKLTRALLFEISSMSLNIYSLAKNLCAILF